MTQGSVPQERTRRRIIGLFFIGVGSAALLTSCQTPAGYREDANEAAYRIINQKQRAVLGETEPFTIDTPEDTLRRRLIEAQMLPVSGPASKGVDEVALIEQWPEPQYPSRLMNDDWEPVPPWESGEPVRLTLIQALQVAARNSRDYQSEKEDVFRAALDLDLERHQFENMYFGMIDGAISTDQSGQDPITGAVATPQASVQRTFKNGANVAATIGLDLVKLLTAPEDEALGIFADATITIPLLRGAGRFIVTEPLRQAERDVVYALWGFQRFKRQFAVDIADSYLSVLQQLDQVENAAENYKSRIIALRRTRTLFEAGQTNEVDVGRARQSELQARNGWINAQQSYENALDQFKLTLGLPVDAQIELDVGELERLARTTREKLGGVEGMGGGETSPADAEPGPLDRMLAEIAGNTWEDMTGLPSVPYNMPPPQSIQEEEPLTADAPAVLEPPSRVSGGPYEISNTRAVRVALENRLDLRTQEGRIFDAQRNVVVAADALEADLDIVGNAGTSDRRGLGTVLLPSGRLQPEDGRYSLGIGLDLPWERTAERNIYRDSYIQLERTARQLQQLEDRVKLSVRQNLRGLLSARESYRIQAIGVQLAESRVESTQLFLEANRGNVEILDVLDAQTSLLDAQNALTAALVNYRIGELELQRDMGVLNVNEKGLWEEYDISELRG